MREGKEAESVQAIFDPEDGGKHYILEQCNHSGKLKRTLVADG